jgi:hypothetical protein
MTFARSTTITVDVNDTGEKSKWSFRKHIPENIYQFFFRIDHVLENLDLNC